MAWSPVAGNGHGPCLFALPLEARQSSAGRREGRDEPVLARVVALRRAGSLRRLLTWCDRYTPLARRAAPRWRECRVGGQFRAAGYDASGHDIVHDERLVRRDP